MRACSIFTCQKMCRGALGNNGVTHISIFGTSTEVKESLKTVQKCVVQNQRIQQLALVVFRVMSLIVSRWCLGGVSVVSRWCLPQWCLAQASLVSRWCLAHASLVSRWCLGDVLAEFPLHLFFCVQKKHATLVDFLISQYAVQTELCPIQAGPSSPPPQANQCLHVSTCPPFMTKLASYL